MGWGSYLSAEKQLVYSTTPANWVTIDFTVYQNEFDCEGYFAH